MWMGAGRDAMKSAAVPIAAPADAAIHHQRRRKPTANGERVVGDHRLGPQHGDKFILAEQVAVLRQEMAQQQVRLRSQRDHHRAGSA